MNFAQHQINVIQSMMDDKRHGLLVFHEPGTGKTRSGVGVAIRLLLKYPNKNVYFLTPKSVMGSWQREIDLQLTKHRISLSRFKIRSHQKWSKKPKDTSNSIIIIDEAHNFRNANEKKPEGVAWSLYQAAYQSFRCILLTGTPVVNSEQDLTPIFSAILHTPLMKEKSLWGKLKWTQIHKHIKGMVSVHRPKANEMLASVHEIPDLIKMPEKYEQIYRKIRDGNMNKTLLKRLYGTEKTKEDSFYYLTRRATNEILGVSPKADLIARYATKMHQKNKRVVIYSQFKQYGIHLVGNRLQVPYGVISGEESVAQRDEAVRDYNEGKKNILLLTGAGSEGLNLLQTHSVVLMEPYWHRARLIQVIARGRRHGAHKNLKSKNRILQVHHMLMTSKDPTYVTADMKMHELIAGKLNKTKKIEYLLEGSSIEKSQKKWSKYLKKIKSLDEKLKNLTTGFVKDLIENFEKQWQSKLDKKLVKSVGLF